MRRFSAIPGSATQFQLGRVIGRAVAALPRPPLIVRAHYIQEDLARCWCWRRWRRLGSGPRNGALCSCERCATWRYQEPADGISDLRVAVGTDPPCPVVGGRQSASGGGCLSTANMCGMDRRSGGKGDVLIFVTCLLRSNSWPGKTIFGRMRCGRC